MLSHIRTVLSFELEASRCVVELWRRWYGSQARLVIHLVWPFRGCPRGWPVLGSHKRTVLSIEPVAMVVSSGDQDATKTQLVWPLSVWKGVPVSVSKILALLSPLPVTNLDEEQEVNDVARIASP